MPRVVTFYWGKDFAAYRSSCATATKIQVVLHHLLSWATLFGNQAEATFAPPTSGVSDSWVTVVENMASYNVTLKVNFYYRAPSTDSQPQNYQQIDFGVPTTSIWYIDLYFCEDSSKMRYIFVKKKSDKAYPTVRL